MFARYNQNMKARKKLYDDAQKILVEEDAALVPLYNEPVLALANDRVDGLQISALNYLKIKKIKLKAN